MGVTTGSRRILCHGLILIFVGLVWGLVVPHTRFPRLALGAHIQFESSGLLFGFMGTILLALPHAVDSLRAMRHLPANGETITISAADPLNLVGILVPGERVAAIGGRTVTYRDGVPVTDVARSAGAQAAV